MERLKNFIKGNKKLHKFLSNISLKIFRNFTTIEIETNPICNRRCLFCPITQDEARLTAMMSDELFNKIVNELKDLRFKGEVCWSSYGEPLLDKRLIDQVRTMKAKLNLKLLCVFTNGDFLTPAKFRELLSAGVDTFYLSQHDQEPSTAIKNLLAELTPLERQHLVVSIVNEDSLLVNRGGSVKVKNLQPLIHCHLRKIYIRADGELRLCADDYFREVRLGNVNENKLIDLWRSPFYRQVRRELARGVFSQSVCRRCVGLEPIEKTAEINH